MVALRPFTEADWQSCPDLRVLVQWANARITKRKRRLFACACCRRVGDRLTETRSREAVEVSERFADGLASDSELRAAFGGARAAVVAVKGWGGILDAAAVVAAERVKLRVLASSLARQDSSPHLTRDLATLCRDIIGNPFRPLPTIPPSILAWGDGTVVRLARAIYDERAFVRLPLLADALLDAGCDNEDILAHCRSEGPHARGCWAVDVILGKS